jgi:hypothetical protein
MGGGVTWQGYQTGWASSNIVNYEVVLASGERVSVNQDSNPDLFWAIKMGSTNYGEPPSVHA